MGGQRSHEAAKQESATINAYKNLLPESKVNLRIKSTWVSKHNPTRVKVRQIDSLK